MIRRRAALVIVALALLAPVAASPRRPVSAQVPSGTPLGTAFTYQGRLDRFGIPITDACDFRFDLYAVPTGGTRLASVPVSNVAVGDGLFTIPTLDFGAAAFAGDARWLEIAVGCPSPSTNLATMGPRQALTAAPYAVFAPQAGSARALWDRPVSSSMPALNQVLKWTGNAWSPAVDTSATYTAGNGLTLSAANQFSVSFAGSGAASSAARSDHNHDTAYAPRAHTHAWSTLTSIPSGFADGIDNDTLFTAGPGLRLAANQFSADFAGSGSANTVARSDHTHSGGTQGWGLSGNAGTNPTTNYLGTTDNTALVIRTVSIERMRVDGSGNVAIGTSGLSARLNVAASSGSGVDASTSATGVTTGGVVGRHTAATGSGSGVFGVTNSTDINASGVAGRVEAATPNAGGSAVSGWHRGTGPNGYGVWGLHSGSGVGVYGSVSGGGVGVKGSAGTSGTALLANGNTQQDLFSGGWVKAMVRYDGAGLQRCFRGDSGSPPASANTCTPFTIVGGGGDHTITFPFAVSSRFVLITPEFAGDTAVMATYAFTGSSNQIRIRTWRPASGSVGGAVLIESAFTLVLF